MRERMEVFGDARLYLADCRHILPGQWVVDAVVTDPPYGNGETNERNLTRGTSSAIWKRGGVKDYGSFDWDAAPITAADIELMRACSKWQIIFGGNFFEGLGPTSCWLVWDKLNTGDFADCELAWTNLPKAVRRIRHLWNGMIRAGHEERFHPTQKPLGVMRWCIEQLPADCNSILDPYMGSGTTGVAAIQAGKKFMGIEREPAYFDIACRRIEAATREPRLELPQPKAEQMSLLDGAA